ncbi:hypothetical protein M2158_004131 [Streptomyces sp. SAI-144]|nr:hypothetical protein [Streptomyces sp. SAI-144]MDH6435654.1 hypothetical protein [Streptomyces sp. SAI-144]
MTVQVVSGGWVRDRTCGVEGDGLVFDGVGALVTVRVMFEGMGS